MSQGDSGKVEDGSKSEIIFNAPALLLMISGFVTALTIPYLLSKLIPSLQLCLILIGAGLILFAISKISIVNKDFHVLFRKKPTSLFYRIISIVGYLLIGLGGIGLILLLFYNR